MLGRELRVEKARWGSDEKVRALGQRPVWSAWGATGGGGRYKLKGAMLLHCCTFPLCTKKWDEHMLDYCLCTTTTSLLRFNPIKREPSIHAKDDVVTSTRKRRECQCMPKSSRDQKMCMGTFTLGIGRFTFTGSIQSPLATFFVFCCSPYINSNATSSTQANFAQP